MKNALSIFIFLLMSSFLFSQGYTIENYDVKVEISKEGYFDIHEKITVNFLEERRGIFRRIPKKYSINGKTQSIVLSKIDVKDHKFKRLSEGNDNIIRIGRPNKYLTGTQKYDLRYRIANSYVFASDHIAFQYNLISDWDAPIKNLNYEIILPDDIALDNDEVLVMTGKQGATNQHVSLEKEDSKISGRSLTSIPAKDNVTIALRFPLGYVAEPIHPFSIKAAKRDKIWTLPLLLSLLTFGFYRARSREENLGSIEDQYFPPEDFSPPVVGAYHDHKVHTEDIISLLPYWANLGYVKILKGKDVLYFNKEMDLPADTPHYQSALFNKIFENEDLIMLQELNTKLGSLVLQMKGQLHKDIVDKELYDKQHYKLFHKGIFLGLGFLLIMGALIAAAVFQKFFLVLTLGIASLIAFIIHGSRPKLSPRGLELKRKLLGLKQFLSDAHPQKINELLKKHPHYFQQMYPYAIAFGIDKTWINKLEGMDIPAPTWYEPYHNSGYGLHTTSLPSKPSMKEFSNDFSIPEITSVFTSVPKPPAGSRSSGGGFSGGGAGGGFGGGGGAW